MLKGGFYCGNVRYEVSGTPFNSTVSAGGSHLDIAIIGMAPCLECSTATSGRSFEYLNSK